MVDSDVLAVLFSNHLALGQFALARATLRDLHNTDPERCADVLRTAIDNPPPDHWLVSDTIPHAESLAWHCAGEYRALVEDAEIDTPDAKIGGAEFDVLLSLIGKPSFTEPEENSGSAEALPTEDERTLRALFRYHWHPKCASNKHQVEVTQVHDVSQCHAALEALISLQPLLVATMREVSFRQRGISKLPVRAHAAVDAPLDRLDGAIQRLQLKIILRLAKEGQLDITATRLRLDPVMKVSLSAPPLKPSFGSLLEPSLAAPPLKPSFGSLQEPSLAAPLLEPSPAAPP
ncbi:hypothetical protein CYMTET_7437 [Cymbomonas tetramitiformis]|uniref:Uncharacterized protein n=1 Tax=Cymbomonas tetramitiformis TaxID=36881 RepID=A0AAE0GVN2_9CHLO|nr:hypothetical protein CYMTET_7437 [Cymbomonas tetramitiformis]